ncbi:MAG: cysteine synthase A [Bacillota bacterium]|nr:cysteine synthase A [Bacillota bacterium]
MRIYKNIEELIGRTPLLELCGIERSLGLRCRLLAKLEAFNPAGSAKDRVAAAMIADAEARGLLEPGAVLIEPTSGNTGVALAALAAARGYRAVFTMPETMSQERRRLLAAYGAEIVLTPGALGMQGAVDRAEALAAEIPGSFLPGQFDNPANPAAHEAATGPEIWEDTEGTVDVFVAGAGTGGTLTGTGRYLKSRKPEVRIVAVEPAASPLLSEGRAGPHGLQGIGANFVPANMDISIIDEIITVEDEDAYESGRILARQEGVLAGITSGAALRAALQIGERPESRGKTIVVLLPDTGERYLSTPLFAE